VVLTAGSTHVGSKSPPWFAEQVELHFIGATSCEIEVVKRIPVRRNRGRISDRMEHLGLVPTGFPAGVTSALFIVWDIAMLVACSLEPLMAISFHVRRS